jgi:hypothetical protein
MPRNTSMVSLPAWLLMLFQYEYPTGCTQSAPPQSLPFVSRTPVVPYGAGNVN